MKIKKVIPIAGIVLSLSISLKSIADNYTHYNYSVFNKDSVFKPDTGKTEMLLPKNITYLELLGQSMGIYSVNYERCVVSKETKRLSLNFGLSYYKYNYYKDSKLFCTLNYQHLFSKAVQFEIGIGSGYGKSVSYLSNRTYFNGFYGIVNTGLRFIVFKRMYIRTNVNLYYIGNDRADLTPYYFFVLLPDGKGLGLSFGITF